MNEYEIINPNFSTIGNYSDQPKSVEMKNYFLKTFTIFFFLIAGIASSYGQEEYLPSAEAFANIVTEATSVTSAIDEWSGPKTMEYYKLVAKKSILRDMAVGIKQGQTVEQVAIASNSTSGKNSLQRVKPLFPDSNGKVGTNWITEEVVIILIK